MPSNTPQNIEIFNRLVAVILLRLYEQFPEPHDLHPSDIVPEAMKGCIPPVEELKKFDVEMSIAGETIEFLTEEGFLVYRKNYRTLDSLTFPQARLTLRGLTLLGLVPESVSGSSDQRTLIAQLKSGIEQGAQDALARAVSSLFATAIRLGAAAVSSL